MEAHKKPAISHLDCGPESPRLRRTESSLPSRDHDLKLPQTVNNQLAIESTSHYQCAKHLLDFSSLPKVPNHDDKDLSMTCERKKYGNLDVIHRLNTIKLVKGLSPLLQLTIPLQALNLSPGDYACSLNTTNEPHTAFWNEGYKLDTTAGTMTMIFSEFRVPSVNFTLKFDLFLKRADDSKGEKIAAFEQNAIVFEPKPAVENSTKPLPGSSSSTAFSALTSVPDRNKNNKMSVMNIINDTIVHPSNFYKHHYPVSESGSDQSATVVQEDLESVSNDGSVSTKNSSPKGKTTSNMFSSQINLNAFAIFRAERTAVLKQLPQKLTFKELQTRIGREWRQIDQGVKAQYRQRATRDLIPSNSLLEQSMKRKIGVKAFSIYRNELASMIGKMSFVQLQREAGRRWKTKSCEEKQKYLEDAREALEQ